ncbi:MAG TPA: ferritin-like domain-containing protein [Gemmatimonadales bacterium]|nr:ferritin-like domain-containing protein [Gemmatimonadales bacterium]
MHRSPSESTSRRSFLSWTGAAGAGLVLAACQADTSSTLTAPVAPGLKKGGNSPQAGSGIVTVDGPTVGLPLSSDTDILKFALFLELLEAEFYKLAVASNLLDGLVLEISTDVRDHEICHVDFLRAALGGAATGNSITFDFSRTLRNERQYLNAAVSFEQTGVGAYLGALPLISDKNLRSVAGTIFTIEARHTAAFRALNHRTPAPVAFETPLTPQQVVSAISPFVVEGL